MEKNHFIKIVASLVTVLLKMTLYVLDQELSTYLFMSFSSEL